MPNSSSGDCNDLKVEDTKMLSINFATPLAGAARTERIKQMTTNHVSEHIATPADCNALTII